MEMICRSSQARPLGAGPQAFPLIACRAILQHPIVPEAEHSR
jgi:hypothetical protein